MTLKELFSVQADLNKLKSLSIELVNLEDFNPYRSNTISDMPKGGTGKDMMEWYVEEKERIENEIEFYNQKLQKDREKVEKFIESAPYPEKDIIRYRAMNNLSWEKTGGLVGYSRRNVSKRFYKYIKLTEKTEMPVVSHEEV